MKNEDAQQHKLGTNNSVKLIFGKNNNFRSLEKTSNLQI